MTDEEAAVMLKKLAEHFREPVSPVSRYCEALRTWQRAVRERDGWNKGLSAEIDHVFLAIEKSSLLWRLIYGGEQVRSARCPTHAGKWDGWAMLNGCEYGCKGTGWLPQR